MDKIIIAFDIDGTLRSNKKQYHVGDATNVIWNEKICQMAHTLSRCKNTRVIIWSGGGYKYAERLRLDFNDKYGTTFHKAYAKFDPLAPKPHIAFDDIQETTLGMLNIIVREK